MKDVAVIHYDDIALKGANRGVFEQSLVQNIARSIREQEIPCTVENRWGRLALIGIHDAPFSSDMREQLRNMLQTTPGVAVFGIGTMTETSLDIIKQGVHKVLAERETVTGTFRIRTTRVDKTYPHTSQEVDTTVGAFVGEEHPNLKVQLRQPDIEVKIEILTDYAYIYIKETGLSGLPVGSSGKAVALLSGGFDSPVAAQMCAVRGITPILLHFHAYPQTSRAAIEKVEELAAQLRTYCGPLTLILAPLLEAQKEIALTAPEKLRVVLYRRLMMCVAEAIAKKYGAHAIITGDVVGQVASQTLENLEAVSDATSLSILRPLCAMHKREILERARAIGTHDISAQPHDDTCTVFVPKRPETKAKMEEVYAAEKKFNTEQLVAHILDSLEVKKV